MRAEEFGGRKRQQKLAAPSHRRRARAGGRSVSGGDDENADGGRMDGRGQTVAEGPAGDVAVVRAGQENGTTGVRGHAEGGAVRELARQRHLLAYGAGFE